MRDFKLCRGTLQYNLFYLTSAGQKGSEKILEIVLFSFAKKKKEQSSHYRDDGETLEKEEVCHPVAGAACRSYPFQVVALKWIWPLMQAAGYQMEGTLRVRKPPGRNTGTGSWDTGQVNA